MRYWYGHCKFYNWYSWIQCSFESFIETIIKYIDIHSHKKNQEEATFSLYNFDPANDLILPEKRYFSFGIHPWNTIKEGASLDVNLLKKYIADPFFVALGETGLDYTIDTCRELQANLFRQHIQMARDLKVKVVIIHCVRAYNDIIKIVKEESYRGALVFHNYNGNIQITQSLGQNRCYFSFGKNLFRESSKLIGFDKSLYDRVLLETDSQNQYVISDIYIKAASTLGLKNEELEALIKSNFNNCFGAILSIS